MNEIIPLLHTPRPRRNATDDFAGCAPVNQPVDEYDALLARLRAQHVPYSVLWELTHRCNLKCVMCYNEPLSEPELSTDECLAVLPQLADAGALRLTLTGGEILTRKDFFVVADEARRHGFSLELKTNGTLVTPELADRLARLAPLQVDISLLGARPETFDAVAGVPRTLKRVLRGVRLLQERGVRVKLNTLLLDFNIDEQQAMLDVAAELGVYYEQVLKISPTDTGSDRVTLHQLSVSQMSEAYVADRTGWAPLPRLPEARTCSVGLSSCLISPYGVVYPCIELRVPAGDLRQRGFVDIWRHAPVLVELRARHTWKNLADCMGCPLQTYCEGRCAGIAWKDHGDMYGGHRTACWQAQARYQQQHPGEALPDTPLLYKQRTHQAARP